ncbi:translation initiation factor IF-2-like [Oenanthe melanoleuca]|uniref:translation initiation factor IF-2-like n=1 Tax=Oenanthe melanoleuca TaxID=2939378 RepID=UPI0024C1151B|nr:translation initiation factor IF-2-like [Oenanthe melanoleuca]
MPWHTQGALGTQQDVTATAHTASTGLSRGTNPPGSTRAASLTLPHVNQDGKVSPAHASPSNTEVGDANLLHSTSTDPHPELLQSRASSLPAKPCTAQSSSPPESTEGSAEPHRPTLPSALPGATPPAAPAQPRRANRPRSAARGRCPGPSPRGGGSAGPASAATAAVPRRLRRPQPRPAGPHRSRRP